MDFTKATSRQVLNATSDAPLFSSTKIALAKTAVANTVSSSVLTKSKAKASVLT